MRWPGYHDDSKSGPAHHLSIAPPEPARASRSAPAGANRGRRLGPPSIDFLEERRAREVEQAMVERLRQSGEMKVPLEDLAKLQAAVALAPALDQAAEMAAHQVDPFFKSRIGARVARSGSSSRAGEK